ncbi:MAG: hypothetical protein IH604_03525 [Burkholderiales bacterium]|nr:hypothetical protein [Burkholderiales bacterium]
MHTTMKQFIVVTVTVLSMVGCNSLPSKDVEAQSIREQEQDVSVSNEVAKEGLRLLEDHRYDDASRVFNAGLKFFPTDARLHFLNGVAYHLLYLAGRQDALALAVAGYELALTHDSAFYFAALQLGRLQFAAKRYDKSLEAFSRALRIEPRNGEALLGIASAAYYKQDLTRAVQAAEHAVELLPNSPEASRALSFGYAALGEHERARQAFVRYAALESNPKMQARLNKRLDQWNYWHMSGAKLDADKASSVKNTKNGSKLTASGKANGAIDVDSDSNAAKPGDASGIDTQPPDPEDDNTPSVAGSKRKAWYECSTDDGQSQFAGNNSNDMGGGTQDDGSISPMPALPTPCYGDTNPRMVVLDVAFIRTEDSSSSSFGTNLLSTLSFSFGINTTRTNDSTNGLSITKTTSWGTTGMEASTLLAYSLNIANATDSRSEVLAKPSLVALDRTPSTFFSGRNLTLGLAGGSTGGYYGYGGSASFQDKPIGVGLAVTPTFIDDDTVALAIGIQRSFIESVSPSVKFDYSLQVSRSRASANVVLKMGQTLILSGISEQEIERSSNGVPLLRDIPLLQYLFNKTINQNFTSSVLVLITPRHPATDRAVMERTIRHIDTLPDPEKRKFRPLIEKALREGGMPDNLDAAYRHAYGNDLFLQFRSGDLSLQHWSRPPRITRLFQDIREILYF